MATIKPIRGLRYNKENISSFKDVVCPPYDIIPDNEVKEYMRKSPYNVIHLERPIGDEPYKVAHEQLEKMKKDGVLCHDADKSIYIYEEIFEVFGEKKSVKGIICGVKLEEFSKKIILPHEETLSKAKQDRFNLMKSTFCNFSQIYSLYSDEQHLISSYINNLSDKEPDVELKDGDGVIHRLWQITDKNAIEKIVNAFSDKILFIADGHHRYETALNFRNYCIQNGLKDKVASCDYVMMMLVDMENDGLVVFPTHRIVKNISDFSVDKIKDICKKYFNVTVLSSRAEAEKNLRKYFDMGKTAFVMYTSGKEFLLFVLKDDISVESLIPNVPTSVKILDVTILHKLILENALGIDSKDIDNQTKLEYTRNIEEAIHSVDENKAQCSFILNPTRVHQISDVAKDLAKMPQKSTYFYPKLITGLVINDLTDK